MQEINQDTTAEESASPFKLYDPEADGLDKLTDTLVEASNEFEVVPGSVQLQYGQASDGETSLSFYDGSLEDQLGIGKGLLLTSGDGAPPTDNTQSSYTGYFSEKFTQTQSGIQSGVNSELKDSLEDVALNLPGNVANSVNDITALTFDINVTNENVESLRFDFVFGSEEYPNFIDSFVDTGVIIANGKNYALFNGQEDQPLSVTSNNVELGNFQNNDQSIPSDYSAEQIDTVDLPIEYNGVSELLSVTVPVEQGTNTITVGVSDTNDSALDTGMILSSLKSLDYKFPDGVGIKPPSEESTDDGSDPDNPFADDVYELPYELENGQFVFGESLDGSLVKGSLDDLVDAKFDFSLNEIENADYAIDPQEKTNYVKIDAGDDIGTQEFIYVQKMILDDFAAAMDTWEGSETWNTFSLLQVAYGQDPTPELFTEWLLEAENSEGMTDLAGKMLDEYAPEITSEELASYLYQVQTGKTLDDPQGMLQFLGMESKDELFSYTAENYGDMSDIEGKFVPLDTEVLDQSNDQDQDNVDNLGEAYVYPEAGDVTQFTAGEDGDVLDFTNLLGTDNFQDGIVNLNNDASLNLSGDPNIGQVITDDPISQEDIETATNDPAIVLAADSEDADSADIYHVTDNDVELLGSVDFTNNFSDLVDGNFA